jgi:hypothetical protein
MDTISIDAVAKAVKEYVEIALGHSVDVIALPSAPINTA